MSRTTPPTRTLRHRPDLDQLKRQAKELLDAFRAGDPDAGREVHAHYRQADPSTFALHDAQLVMARAHGFDSWPKLKAFVDGMTVRRLVEAVRDGNLETVRSMVTARPELVHLDVAENDEHRALHHAVLSRRPDIVRFLMQHGADARKGIWPHRGATTAFRLAVERDYHELVAIIEEEESRRPASAPLSAPPRGGSRREARPRAAIATGDAAWLRARHADGMLGNGDGLVSHAVAADRPDMLALLLDLGLDPDESGRVGGLEEVVPTWGEPLRACAIEARLAMAEMLLAHGANANTNVYAATSAMYEAYKRRDESMMALLERHGGRLTAVAVAELGLVDACRRGSSPKLPKGARRTGSPGRTRASRRISCGAPSSRPSPEIVTLALRATDWPREDPRWHGILENGLYLGPDSDRARHLDAFRLVLDRCDPNVRSKRGAVLVHDVAASRGGLTASDRVAYTTLLLDHGARLDFRDDLLQSTPLGWACRWGRVEMVKLLLERGADPLEADAEPWATPAAWAKKDGPLRDRDVTGGRGSR